MPISPLPWKTDIWEYPTATPPRKELVIESPTHRLAIIDWDWNKDNPYRVPFEEGLANGRLMVAAPKLLAELKNLVDAYADLCRAHPATSDIDAIPRAVKLANARAAIAAAEGQP